MYEGGIVGMDDMIDFIGVNIVVGFDMIVIILSVVFYYLYWNLDILVKLRVEIDGWLDFIFFEEL